jgi:peptide/nickel transport system ATP-binding protein
MALLEVDELSVRFDSDEGSVHAVDRVSFSLEPGEVLAMVGESGCGKSVTAMSLLRLLPASATLSGAVRFGDRDLLTTDESSLRNVRGREISFVFQEPMTSLNPVFTVGRQIAEVLRHHLDLDRAQAHDRTLELLELVGIPAPGRRIDEYPHQLSGGMRQRVMIAMAVACNPKVLIADEPTTALDVTIQAGILDLMRDIRERLGTAILLITHDLGVVADVADRVMVMYAGRLVEQATADELFAHPQHPYTTGLLAALPRSGRRSADEPLQEIPGVVPSLAQLPDACAFAPRCPRSDEECEKVPPLEPVRPQHPVACFHPGEAVWNGR